MHNFQPPLLCLRPVISNKTYQMICNPFDLYTLLCYGQKSVEYGELFFSAFFRPHHNLWSLWTTSHIQKNETCFCTKVGFVVRKRSKTLFCRFGSVVICVKLKSSRESRKSSPVCYDLLCEQSGFKIGCFSGHVSFGKLKSPRRQILPFACFLNSLTDLRSSNRLV